MLGTSGHDGLRCRSRHLQLSEIARDSQLLNLTGDRWRDVASVNSSLWMLGDDGLVKLAPEPSVQIIEQYGSECKMCKTSGDRGDRTRSGTVDFFPHTDFAHAVMPDLSAIAAFNDRFLLGLESTGVLHVWSQHGGKSGAWQIADKGTRWLGLCASSTSLFLAGARHKDNSAGIWRVALPTPLSSLSTPTERGAKSRHAN